MKIDRHGELLQEELDSARILAPQRTGVFFAARDNLAMVRAYLDDSRTFLASGDPVNAFAASYYGEGWLHCGAACGLFSLASPQCLFSARYTPLPEDAGEKLREKTVRYDRLLATARRSIRPAAERGTALFITADRTDVVAAFYAMRGEMFLARDRFEAALACFSYGHGWIDAGVRAGLLAVTGSREIFPI